MNEIDIQLGKCEEVLPKYPENSIDLLASDFPYGYNFMGKNWDKVVIGVPILKEIIRVMKPGAFGFVMCAPRQDVLSRLIVNLQDAGFNTGFSSLYWTYASGFPKAANASKMMDKREGMERPRVNNGDGHISTSIHKSGYGVEGWAKQNDVPITEQAKALQGAYLGFQPKPAVEIIVVCMKPLSEDTYIAQAMANQKGVTWLDDGRIPATNEELRGMERGYCDFEKQNHNEQSTSISKRHSVLTQPSNKGRFPANLLVSDGVLDGTAEKKKSSMISSQLPTKGTFAGNEGNYVQIPNKITERGFEDECTFSDYFSLDRWWAQFLQKLPKDVQSTFPFLAVPKPAKTEKDKGLNKFFKGKVGHGNLGNSKGLERFDTYGKNVHPTVKPLQLFTYLLTIGSRPNDLVLDPFAGSGTTGVAAKLLRRKCLLVEMNEEYVNIMKARLLGNPIEPDITAWARK